MLVTVKRAYGGQEGKRIKAGTIFAVGNAPVEGYRTITDGRYRQLAAQGIVAALSGSAGAAPHSAAQDLGEEERDAPAPRGKPGLTPIRKPAPARRQAVEPDSAPPPVKPSARRTARKKAQEDSPKAPRPLQRRGGSPDGDQEQPASSSQEVRRSGSLTLKQRGVRRGGKSAGSLSITPSERSPGPTPSTPATQRGGASTTPKSSQQADPAAFE